MLWYGAFELRVCSVYELSYAADLLRLMGANEQIIESGSSYAKIVFAGNTPFFCFFYVMEPSEERDKRIMRCGP